MGGLATVLAVDAAHCVTYHLNSRGEGGESAHLAGVITGDGDPAAPGGDGYGRDPLAAWALGRPEGLVVPDDTDPDPDNTFCALVHDRWGKTRRVGLHIGISGDAASLLWLYRCRAQPVFDDQDGLRLGWLHPHLRTALRLRHRLGLLDLERQWTARILDGLDLGLMIVQGDGSILHANARAEGFLQQGRGLVRDGDGRLRAARSESDTRLQQTLTRIAAAAAAGREARGANAVTVWDDRMADSGPLAVIVQPLVPAGDASGPVVLVAFAVAPTQRESEENWRILCTLYRLTPREARVAWALAYDGLNLNQISQRDGVSINTVRSHVRTIFAKMGVDSQPALVRMVLRSPAGLVVATGGVDGSRS